MKMTMTIPFGSHYKDDDRLEIAAESLSVVAKAKHLLDDIAHDLKRYPDTVRSKAGLNLYTANGFPGLELYAEAEMSNGDTITWWTDLCSSGDLWSLSVRLLLDHKLGQDAIAEGEPFSSATLHKAALEMTRQLTYLTDDLGGLDAVVEWWRGNRS